MNSGREDEIVDVFCNWLIEQGWEVQTQVAWVDVVARRGEERLVGEAKGVTTAPGLDVDTMYGQLLRRMTDEPGTRYAHRAREGDPGSVPRFRVHSQAP